MNIGSGKDSRERGIEVKDKSQKPQVQKTDLSYRLGGTGEVGLMREQFRGGVV